MTGINSIQTITHRRGNQLRRVLLACGAAAALAAAPLTLAQLGDEHGGSGRNAPPAPPAAPTPAAVSVEPPSASAPMIATTIPQPGAPAESSYSMVVNDNGRTIKLEMKNNVVTHAEIDGQTVPDDRIENDGDVVRLKDDKGEVVYEHELPGDFSWNGRGFAALDLNDPGWRALSHLRPEVLALSGQRGSLSRLGSGWTFTDPGATSPIAEAAEPPSVMMGVQMGTPDSTICGHLGLDRERVTLLTAVHDGLPAASAGLEPYDLIVALNGGDDAGPAAIRAALKDKKAGDTLKLSVFHKGARKDVTVNLEAYDRKKLSASKAHRIETDGESNFFVAAAPSAPIPPVPPTIPEEYRQAFEEYAREITRNSAPRAMQFRSRGGGGSGTPEAQQKMLEDLMRDQERAAAQADAAARRASELARRMSERAQEMQGKAQGQGGAGFEDMRERMRRMEEMMEKMLNEKTPPANPEQPKAKESGNKT